MRAANTVMKLERLGSMHASRLSFLRVLLRRIAQEKWQVRLAKFDIDQNAEGVAIYTVKTPHRYYSLVAFSHDLPPEFRSDRVIAQRWDSTFALYDGIPDDKAIEYLGHNTPYQEKGRYNEKVLVLSRANRSVRLFQYVLECLQKREQPDIEIIKPVGYLMRTTAVYGNGKFGIADLSKINNRPEFSSPFQAEMLCVWLIREFTFNLVEHLAKINNPKAVRLDTKIKQSMGVGNSTGLGMAPFLIKHPALLNQWINAKEIALDNICNLATIETDKWQKFKALLTQQFKELVHWQTTDDRQNQRIKVLHNDLQTLLKEKQSYNNWSDFFTQRVEKLTLETQELIISLVLECYPEKVDYLVDKMSIDEKKLFNINGQITVGTLLSTIEKHYHWANEIDIENPKENANFWYYSKEKMEPRLGNRYVEEGAELEQPLCYPKDIMRLKKVLEQYDSKQSVGDFLSQYPEFRHAVRRIQITSAMPYAEIQDNFLAEKLVPIDLLRCKLSFFGAKEFDPKSDKWLRINMFRNAPLVENIQLVPLLQL